jgi:hypothetical protein
LRVATVGTSCGAGEAFRPTTQDITPPHPPAVLEEIAGKSFSNAAGR